MAGTYKTKPFLTPDWTQMDGRSKPFYQAASGSSLERYSVTVISQYDNIGGTKRQDRMDESVQPGLNRILKYYSKIPSGSMSDAVAEDFFIPLRPKAKMKVLVSFPCASLETLPAKKLTLPVDKSPEFEIQLNTSGIRRKLDIATTSIVKYGEEIEKFHGKVYGFDYDKESSKLLGFLPALIQLMQDNDIIFSDADSNLITLLATAEYEIIYGTLNKGNGPIVLSKGFDTFMANQSVKYKRVVKILSKLNDLEHTIINNKNLSWSEFFERFIYNPPKFDFSTPRPASPTLKEDIKKALEKDNRNPVKTREQVHLFAGFVDLPENSKALTDFSEQASVFIGDSIIGNFDKLGNFASDVSAIYGDVLSATGLDGILKSALDCLDIKSEWGLGDASEGLLNTINQLFSQIEAGLPHNIPTLTIPDDYKISNLLKDIGLNIAKAIVGAVIGALTALIQELIKLLFQFCSECSIRTEDGAVKKYNKLNFGSNSGLSWSGFAGKVLGSGALWQGATHRLAGGVIGGFSKTEFSGHLDSFQQDVLKNGINNIDRLYDHEAQRIFDILKSGVSGETHALYSGTGPTGYFTRTEQVKNTLAFQFGSTPQELNKSGFNKDMTLEQVREIVKRKSPWSSAVFQEASKQLSEYLDAVLTSWTPGEIGNAMLGCGIAPDAKEVARNALPAFPALDFALRGDDDDSTDDNLADIWATMGKMVGHEPVLKSIAELAGNIPERLKCLNDLDDTNLRKRLLAEKDPTLSPEEIADQVAKAKKRNRDKIQQISDLIGRDDILQGKMPPLYCSQSADGTMIPGILPVSHPTTVYAIRRALNTTYDSLKITFNDDISSWVPALSIKTLTPVEIPRTTIMKGGVFGDGERIFHPDFKRMVREGLVTYGSLPYGAIVPNSRTPPEERDDPWLGTSDGDPTEIKYNWFMSMFSDEWDNPQGRGMWEEGQTEPTPEQEHEWQKANLKWKLVDDPNVVGRRHRERTGGRRWEIANVAARNTENPPPNLLGQDWRGNELTIVDYTKKFGYSPIPVHELKEGPPQFIPGVKDTIQNMCTDESLFNIKLGSENKYSFFVPNNMFKDVDFNEIQKNMDEFRGDLVDKIKVDGVWEKIKGSLNAVANSKWKIQYVVPSFAGSIEIPKDEYRIGFSVETPNFPADSKDDWSTLNLPGVKDSLNLPEPARKVIENQTLTVLKNPAKPQEIVQPQAGLFYDFSNNVWETGGTLYRNGVKVRGDSSNRVEAALRSSIPRPFLRPVFDDPGLRKDAFVEFLYDQNTYKNLFKDLFCSFSNQLAESPYLGLQRSDDGKPGMLSVNWTPMKLLGWDPSCQKTLLDVEIIKEQIVREHDLLKCIKRSWRTEEDGSSNRNAPYQIASRAGCILLTIRTYVIEYLLRFAYSFHYFTPSSVNDVDQTSVYYVYNRINQEITARGLGTEYSSAFQKETIELYNRNKPTDEQYNFATDSSAPPEYIHFRKALEPLIRYQIYSVSRRFSRDFMDLRGDVDGGDPHSILIQEWLPTVEPSKKPGELRFANEDGTNKKLKSFNEVTDVQEVSMNELAATAPGGTLTDDAIARMPDPFRNERQSHAVGKLFRDYFFPNRRFSEFTTWTPSEITQTAEALWPIHAYGQKPLRDPNKNVTWLKQPVMMGTARETNILAPSSRITGIKGLQSGPDIGFGTSQAMMLTSGPGRQAFQNQDATQNRYAVGVSVVEQKAMNTMTQMMYATQTWAPNILENTAIRIESSNTSRHWNLEGEELTKVRDWYEKANSFFIKMDLPYASALAATTEENIRQQAAIAWEAQRTHAINNAKAVQALGDKNDEDAKARVALTWDRGSGPYPKSAYVARAVAKAKAPGGAIALSEAADVEGKIIAQAPFWAADSKAGTWGVIGKYPDGFGNNFTSKEMIKKSKYFGPGSLLRMMTMKKRITSYGANQHVFQHRSKEANLNPLSWFISMIGDPVYAPGHSMFVAHGLTWPVYKVEEPYHSAWEPSQEANATPYEYAIVGRPTMKGTNGNQYRTVWMDPYSDRIDSRIYPYSWQPRADNLMKIGMPDLPQEYLNKLGEGGKPLPAYGETDIQYLNGDGALDMGGGVAMGGGRSNHLLFYLLPQHHWLGWLNSGKRSKWYKNVETAIHNNQRGYTQYISLLDLHPDAVRRALIWEQGMYANFVAILEGNVTDYEGPIRHHFGHIDAIPFKYRGADKNRGSEIVGAQEEINFYKTLINKYDTWIEQWEEVMEDLKAGKEQRRCIQEKALAIINSGKLPRNNMQTPPMYDIDEGNPILEPYIRVIDYTEAEAAELEITDNVKWVKTRPQITKGVVNIDKWDEFMQTRFPGGLPQSTATANEAATSESESTSSISQGGSGGGVVPAGDLAAKAIATAMQEVNASKKRKPPIEVIAATSSDEDCGDGLPSRVDRPQPPTEMNPELQLKDYFKEIHYGLRIMYLPKPNNFSDTLTPETISSTFVSNEKAFWVKEGFDDGSGYVSRWLNPYPLVATETPLDMLVTVKEASTPKPDGSLAAVSEIVDGCGLSVAAKPAEPIYAGYFRWTFKSLVGGERFTSPRDILQNNIVSTDEYKFLFKYCFPLDRMLSLLNIYSSTYLSSLPDIQQVFEPTKEELMGIFMRSLQSGDLINACRTGNIDLLEALMNGMKLPWASLLRMALQWPMLVFKGFMEQSDINIAISKNIQKTIKMMNATIAAIQTQANAVHQAGASFAASMEQLAGAKASGSCGFGITLPDQGKPPDALFDKVEDNLLYVPETWMIGLALLPSTIFAPYLWGPPISIPHGLLYWALDDSHINWLNAFPDFPNDLWARKDELLKEAITKQDCPPDFDPTNIFNNGGSND